MAQLKVSGCIQPAKHYACCQVKHHLVMVAAANNVAYNCGGDTAQGQRGMQPAKL
jgi:hypothetical protein